MPTNTLNFEIGKVYCIGLPVNEETTHKRLVLYQGEDTPWEDICTGETAPIDQECICEVVEVPEKVIDAIKLAQENKSLIELLSENNYSEDSNEESWEVDNYYNDWDD